MTTQKPIERRRVIAAPVTGHTRCGPAITMSILSGEEIGQEIERRYSIGKVRHCFLLRAAINHFYVVVTDVARFAARVSLGEWRTKVQNDLEASLQNHLRKSGVSVVTPVAMPDGAYCFGLAAPEGERSVVVYEWVRETELPNLADAENLGEFGKLVAAMHVACGQFDLNGVSELSVEEALTAWMPFLEPHFEDRRGDADMIVRLADSALGRYRVLSSGKAPCFIVHGDLHAGNALIDETSRITLLDFDFCGRGPVAYDVASYLWGSEQIGLDPGLNEAFLKGYESVRTLTQVERDALPSLIVAKAIWWLALRATLVDRLGSAMFARRSIDWFMTRLKRDAIAAGMLL